MRAAAAAVLIVAACGGAAPHSAPPAKVADLNRAPGELVRVEAHLAPGLVTIVDFHAAWCGACAKLEAMLAADLAADDAIVIRRVDVGAGRTPVARAYQIGALPHLRIFDRGGGLRYVLVGNDTLRAAELARAVAAE